MLPSSRRRCTLPRRARWVCARATSLPRHGLRFTTSYHTQFPQYLRERFPIPLRVSYAAAAPVSRRRRALHGEHRFDAQGTARGVQQPRALAARCRHEEFRPRQGLFDLPRPIAAYVGRVAVEKNVDAFLRMPWAGSKLVIGRWAGARAAAAAVSGRHLSPATIRRRAGRPSGRGRRPRVSEPDRHFRPRHPGNATRGPRETVAPALALQAKCLRN